MFRIYPAIDILDGKCVRLRRGDYAEEFTYREDPLQAAREWEVAGATFLHVIDLDGAREGRPVNRKTILRLIDEVDIPVQVGGGIRELEQIRDYLDSGAARVILGTRAIMEPDFLGEAISRWGERVLVSVDVGKGGEPSIKGWTETVQMDAEELVDILLRAGVKRMIHTNTWKDGTLEGYDPGPLEPFLDRGLKLIAAGGITTIDDLRTLRSLTGRGVEGAVLGRALYAGTLTLEQALRFEAGDR